MQLGLGRKLGDGLVIELLAGVRRIRLRAFLEHQIVEEDLVAKILDPLREIRGVLKLRLLGRLRAKLQIGHEADEIIALRRVGNRLQLAADVLLGNAQIALLDRGAIDGRDDLVGRGRLPERRSRGSDERQRPQEDRAEGNFCAGGNSRAKWAHRTEGA